MIPLAELPWSVSAVASPCSFALCSRSCSQARSIRLVRLGSLAHLGVGRPHQTMLGAAEIIPIKETRLLFGRRSGYRAVGIPQTPLPPSNTDHTALWRLQQVGPGSWIRARTCWMEVWRKPTAVRWMLRTTMSVPSQHLPLDVTFRDRIPH